MFSPPLVAPVRTLGGRPFDFSTRLCVVGIVNRTPNSFFDRGATMSLPAAQRACERAIADGADWLDLGGVPFAHRRTVSEADEVDRVLPLVRWLAGLGSVVVSVDTARASVAERVLAEGAHIINDTSALSDPLMPEVVARTGAGVVVCHSLAAGRSGAPRYDDVVSSVRSLLVERVDRALDAGVDPSRVFVDPGHDLDKNTDHSLELTRRLSEITELGYPTLVAVSNKDFVGEVLDAPVTERAAGSLAVMVYCALAGARLLRTHHVREAAAAARMLEATLGWRAPLVARHNRAEPAG